jgi:protein TonB
LNVTGRASRGIGNDWYAVSWNDQTVFVRTSDATTGSGAPPEMVVRERPPPEVIEEEEEQKPGEEAVEESPFAEPAPPSGSLSMGDVNWVRAPSARDFARDAGVSGSVTLDCIIGGGGRLACSVAGESPDGYGFGRAAINISRQLRVSTSLSDGSSAAGRNLILPLSFRAG